MSRLKLFFIEKFLFNLSLTKKWIFMSLLAALLLIIKSACLAAFEGTSYPHSDDLLTTISHYHLLADLGFYLLFIALLYYGLWVIKKHGKIMNHALSDAIKSGSVDADTQFSSKSELDVIARMVCNETGAIQQKLKVQQEIAEALHGHIEPLITCMEIVSESIDEEFEQVDLLATAMNEMTATVNEIANSTNSASLSTADASDVAKESSQFIDATILTVNSLSSNMEASADAVNSVDVKVEGIGSVVDTIRSISEQTNLLALNAAIEAARAGEYGRGFAVVADEVRNLAKRTQDSTVEIQGIIEQLQKGTQDAVSLMGKSVQDANVGAEQITKAGSQLTGLVEKFNHISDMNYQIVSATDEQKTVAGDINQNLEQVRELVEGSVIVIKEITEMAEEMGEQVEKLNKID